MITNMDKFAAQSAADVLVAKAAIMYTDPLSLNWPEKFMEEQALLIVNNKCNGDAHDSTCVASLRYERMIKD